MTPSGPIPNATSASYASFDGRAHDRVYVVSELERRHLEAFLVSSGRPGLLDRLQGFVLLARTTPPARDASGSTRSLRAALSSSARSASPTRPCVSTFGPIVPVLTPWYGASRTTHLAHRLRGELQA